MSSNQAPIVQAAFDSRISTLAFPMGGTSPGNIQRGYMVWDQVLPGYSSKAFIQYLWNPSTVEADYNIADASAQAALNFPNPNDTAQLAIPLYQTASWSLYYDRTFELWQSYNTSTGTPNNTTANATDPSVIGVAHDWLIWQQFTGMLTNYSYGTNGAGSTITAPTTAAQNYALNKGIMQLVPCWMYFGNSSTTNNLSFYGYINEWTPQFTHWTQHNIPMRMVIDVNVTLLPPPSQTTAPGGLSAKAAAAFTSNGEGNLQIFNAPTTPTTATTTNPSTILKTNILQG
jgi:hypothetical protein